MLNDVSNIRVLIEAIYHSLQSWTFWKAHVRNVLAHDMQSDHDYHPDVLSASICVVRHANSRARTDVSKNVPK
jgi:hypothetical protein